MKINTKIITALALTLVTSWSLAKPIESFSHAKRLLMSEVYKGHYETVYCAATFNDAGEITLPAGFQSDKHQERTELVEWEHIVPAESLGRRFIEWRNGAPKCVDKKGEPYKGERCAKKVNREYRQIHADLYNLHPAIGAVKAMRGNRHFDLLPSEKSDFGSCQMKIADMKAEPSLQARGRIARTYLYMDKRYPRYRLGKSQRKLMLEWDELHPITNWECKRARRIKKIQGNTNPILAARCGP